MGKIRSIHEARPEQALENLNRLTGLQFERWPESLRPSPDGQKKAGHKGRLQARNKASAD